jgi:hypothetical protein
MAAAVRRRDEAEAAVCLAWFLRSGEGQCCPHAAAAALPLTSNSPRTLLRHSALGSPCAR